MTASARMTNGERVARRRAVLRAAGLRPRQFWLPDPRSAEFRAEARRAALAIVASASHADDQAFVDSLADWNALPPWDAE